MSTPLTTSPIATPPLPARTRARPRRKSALGVTAGLLGALLLLGCTPGADPDELAHDPQTVGTELPPASTEDYQLPLVVEPLEVVEPDWDLDVRMRGGVFLSAGETEKKLRFSAVDTHGTVLWTAERTPEHTAFTATTGPDGTDIAVLTGAHAGDTGIAATAYDLTTGEQLWGPVEVPGPQLGAGLVYGSAEEPANTIALDPATGDVRAEGSADTRLIGEYDGTLISLGGGALQAMKDGETLWEVPVAGHDWDPEALTAFPGAQTGDGYVHLTDGENSGPVIDLDSGQVLAESARGVARDANTGALAILGDSAFRVIDDTGETELPISVADSARLEAAVGGLVFLRDGSSLRVHNMVTGSVARAYRADGSGTVAVPAIFTPEGVGTLEVGGTTLLATDRVVEQPAEEGQPAQEGQAGQ